MVPHCAHQHKVAARRQCSVDASLPRVVVPRVVGAARRLAAHPHLALQVAAVQRRRVQHEVPAWVVVPVELWGAEAWWLRSFLMRLRVPISITPRRAAGNKLVIDTLSTVCPRQWRGSEQQRHRGTARQDSGKS